jgi:hypothetical protein
VTESGEQPYRREVGRRTAYSSARFRRVRRFAAQARRHAGNAPMAKPLTTAPASPRARLDEGSRRTSGSLTSCPAKGAAARARAMITCCAPCASRTVPAGVGLCGSASRAARRELRDYSDFHPSEVRQGTGHLPATPEGSGAQNVRRSIAAQPCSAEAAVQRSWNRTPTRKVRPSKSE